VIQASLLKSRLYINFDIGKVFKEFIIYLIYNKQ